MKQNKKDSSQGASLLWIIITSSIFIIAACSLNAFIFIKYIPTEDFGDYGEMFGPVNALFSGFAFCGVIVAILLQRQELTLQREELSHTREEIRGQKEQLELQNITLKKQNFENTFFAMLTLFGQIISSMEFDNRVGTITKGRPYFKITADSLRTHYKRETRYEPTQEEDVNIIQSFYRENQSDLNHYFKYLKSILKFIDSALIENKGFYADFLKSQFSNDELAVTFYYAFYVEKDDLSRLLKKYHFLTDMPQSLLLNPKKHHALLEEDPSLLDKLFFGKK